MKDQYFGDINDYRKFGLLRALAARQRLRLGVSWMLTPPTDGPAGRSGPDGRLLRYLEQPARYRPSDPALFDWLRQVVALEGDRRVARIEGSGLLGRAAFWSPLLGDDAAGRERYMAGALQTLAGCDLLFFDPDNGLEVPSTPMGRAGSQRYLYWREVTPAFETGASVLVYQHLRRVARGPFIARLASELSARTDAASVFFFRTPRVVFLLAAQSRHARLFRGQLDPINARWGAKEIVAAEQM